MSNKQNANLFGLIYHFFKVSWPWKLSVVEYLLIS